MPKTTERLTKKAVLDEVQAIRDKIRHWRGLGMTELELEYDKHGWGRRQAGGLTRERMMTDLIVAATYHMTNVLGLE